METSFFVQNVLSEPLPCNCPCVKQIVAYTFLIRYLPLNRILRFLQDIMNSIIHYSSAFINHFNHLFQLIKRQSCHHICSANQLTGFYMMATLAFNELITSLSQKFLPTCKYKIGKPSSTPCSWKPFTLQLGSQDLK